MDLLRVKNRNAVQTALNHLLDMLRLCRSDNMGVRDLVPLLYIRLDKDQECYDFIKWWHVCDPDGKYDWGDMSLPNLNIKNADVTERLKGFDDARFGSLPHAGMMCLVKFRLLQNLREIQKFQPGNTSLPVEILDQIRANMLPTTIQGNAKLTKDIENGKIGEVITELEGQLGRLYQQVSRLNSHYWKLVLKPGRYLHEAPGAYSRGTLEEVIVWLPQTIDAWSEIPGAMDWVKQKTGRR